MTKELKALENLWYGQKTTENYKLIETALNEKANIENRLDKIFDYYGIKSFTELEQRLESYEDLVGDLSIEAEINKENQTKLKALKTIKETIPIEERDFFYDKETDTYFFIGRKVSKEQFDLLKEVLL